MDSFDKTLGGMVVKRRRDQGGEEEEKMEKRASCPSAASLYTFPTQSSSVDASSGPVVFTWNAACLDPTITNVDLKLYAPELEKPIIKVWTGIPASDGSYSTTLLPKWWNSTSSIQLQVTLSDSNNLGLSFLSSTVAGPVFKVTYPQEKLVTVLEGGSTVAAAPADTAVVDSIYTTASILSSDGGLNAGSVFAAVFFPIVILLAGIFVYVRWARAKQSKKRERWSKAIDNRMSVLSTSWNPNSGTSSDPRKSISSSAANNNRRTQVGSVYSTSPYDGRPSQSSSHLRDPSSPSPQQEMSQTSFARPATSVFLATGEQRASRVSFAFVDTPNSRVSFAEGSSPRGQESFARGGRGVSQVGTGRPSISIYSTTDGTKQAAGGRGRDSSEEMVSPDQAAGPWVLGNEEEVEEELSSMAAVRSELSFVSFCSTRRFRFVLFRLSLSLPLPS
ncbi:hypothetical protein BDY24DRAFT_105822 [Mrakia frigida]|uniref:uncharacterized protein n=1 Tax=Mrakia frigida TaxID=29902 RepID=UPI003FCC158F